jgi:hypothetical protein
MFLQRTFCRVLLTPVAPKISNPRETDLKKNRRTRGNELGYSQQVSIISLCGMGNELDNQL